MHFVILCDIYDTGTEMMPEVGEIIWQFVFKNNSRSDFEFEENL